jgi:hypothetical protein
MDRSLIVIAFAASSIAVLTGIVAAKGQAAKDALPPGSVSHAEGLEAWKRIEAVVTHPRCATAMSTPGPSRCGGRQAKARPECTG